MLQKLAIYAGSFDPPTTGHLWMIEQGSKMFDSLNVSIGINPDKLYMFSLEERLDMLRKSTSKLPNVKITHYSNQYLIAYAKSVNAQFILRGIRNQSDYEYERVMRNLNGDFNPNTTTVFLMPPREIAEVSSSMVKGLVGPEGWEQIVKEYLPEAVFEKLVEVHNARSK